MKKNLFPMTLCLMLLFSFVSFGQTNKEISELKSTMTQIFDLCQANNFEKAGNFFVYTGKDKNRYYNDVYNLKKKSEANKVKRLVRKIKAFFKISDTQEIISVKKREESGVNLYDLEVTFTSGSQKLTTKFSFIKLGNKFLLAEIH